MRARAIMVLGTSSHVGKSLLTAALCRIFADQGVSVAPFKSQNMSLNSSATLEGLEIGRAQALQAEAARIPASVHMNPILLKPAGNMTSQVVVRGKIWGRLSASDYHQRRVEELLPIVRESYEILAAKHEVIILCRWTTLPLSYYLGPARSQQDAAGVGQGARIASLTTRGTLIIGSLFTVAICIWLLRTHAAAAIVATLLVTLWSGRYFQRRIGGVTGDCFGATNQLAEIAVYLTGAWIA